MDKYIRLHQNMRVNTLFFLGLIALLLICSDTDSVSLLIMTKVAGFALIGICFLLGRRWHRSGKLQEIDDIVNDEEDEQ